MARNSKKAIEATEVIENAVDTAAAETAVAGAEQAAYAWVNWVTEKCTRARTSKTGKPFVSVSLPYPEADENAKGQKFCSFAVNPAQVKPATIKATGEKKDGFVNIFLGKADSMKTISYIKGGVAVQEKVPASELARLYEENRAAYKAQVVEA